MDIDSARGVSGNVAPSGWRSDGNHPCVLWPDPDTGFPEAVRVDIPVDKPSEGLILTKQAQVETAAPGDFIRYDITVSGAGSSRTGIVTITDELPIELRLRADSVMYNGAPAVASIAPDGRRFTVTAPVLNAGQTGKLSYIAEVRPDARTGVAVNRATATDSRGGTSNEVDAPVRIEQDLMTERFVVTGRVTEGGCIMDPKKAKGIAGVRVMLEDGTYTVTDLDGRYHFEGVRPGKHVVQIDTNTLPLDQEALDCPTNNRSAESPISRFVEGKGGVLKRADFRTHTVEARNSASGAAFQIPTAISDAEAAGAETDWLAGQTPGTAFLYPLTNHNPRLRSTRVAIKHPAGMKVELLVNGKPAPGLNYDGIRTSANKRIQVSLWRGLSLEPGANILSARVVKEDGTVHQELTQTVYLSGAPMQAKLIPEFGPLSCRRDQPPGYRRALDRPAMANPHHMARAERLTSPPLIKPQSKSMRNRHGNLPAWIAPRPVGKSLAMMAWPISNWNRQRRPALSRLRSPSPMAK